MNDEQKHIMSEKLLVVSTERACLVSYKDEYVEAALLLVETKALQLVV